MAEAAVKSGVNATTAVIPKKKHKYGLKEISGRLLELSKGQRGFIAFATIASIVGNLSQMGLVGFFSIILSEAGFDVTGIDMSVEMIKQAEENADAMETDPTLLVMDIEEPDFEDNTFDMIVSRNVVWSLTEPEKAYKNWLKLLKPGGRLLVFDGDHLKGLREPEKAVYEHDSYSEEYRKIYGKEPKCSFTKDNFDEARGWRTDLPLAKEKRPEWDVEICKKAGYEGVNVEWVNEKVFADEREIYLHRGNPYFLITGSKKQV